MSQEFLDEIESDLADNQFAEFTTDVVYHSNDDLIQDLNIKGIFEVPHVEVDAETTAVVAGGDPMLLIRESDLPNGTKKGDKVTIKGKVYHVLPGEPDGAGVLQIPLKEIANA